MVGQVLDRLDSPNIFVSADEPTLGDSAWLAALWERARIAAADTGKAEAVLLMPQGLTKSPAGRFEVVHLPHWSFVEMRAAFGFSLEQYLHFGGCPGAAPLIKDPQRWKRYLLDALIETTIARDVLLMTRVDKPALLRRLFHFGCRYSGQVLSYTKMLGQLQDSWQEVLCWPPRGRRCDTGFWRKDRPRRLFTTLSRFAQCRTLDGDARWGL